MVQGLDSEILLPGHSVVGVKQDATDARVYVETLRDGVKSMLTDGKSEDDIIASDLISKYESWDAYEQFRPLNIKGMDAGFRVLLR